MKTEYDVTFVPMTCVAIDTDNPQAPSEQEQAAIAEMAAKNIAENFEEKINCENLAHIRLYSVNGEPVKQDTIFDNGCLRICSRPIDEAVRLLTELATSGYIPFSSPSPSSTEIKLKHCITSAISLLESAQILEKDLGYK